jgi:outer membrane protein assembly factor BamD (BamD/ComL family)
MEKTDESDQCELTAEELKEQGNTQLREGKVEEAISSYSQSIGK